VKYLKFKKIYCNDYMQDILLKDKGFSCL